jgi:hypothetical protein
MSPQRVFHVTGQEQVVLLLGQGSGRAPSLVLHRQQRYRPRLPTPGDYFLNKQTRFKFEDRSPAP